MKLDQDDLKALREIVREEVREAITDFLKKFFGAVRAELKKIKELEEVKSDG